MKRFHVNLTVRDLQASISFYETFFGEKASVVKDDYAKWMLEDPRVNFSIAQSTGSRGVNHVGLQVESQEELDEIQARLDRADELSYQQPDAECCYARSTKTWSRDPDNVAWETFLTHGPMAHYGDSHVPQDGADVAQHAQSTSGSRCCA